VEYD
jgi:hypothetical protein